MQQNINMVQLEGNDLILFNQVKNSPKFYNYDERVLKLIISRGINTEKAIEEFLFSNVNHLSNPSEMKDSDKFCTIVNETVEHNEDIIIYTDYDMDGIGAGKTGVSGLRNYCKLKNSTSHIDWYANSRFVEGYGITPGGVDDLVNKFPNVKLIITTDNGIVGYAGVARAKEIGLKIIVTDHHQPGKTNPIADAIIDPHQKDCNSSFKEFCGAGVIFKLLMKLYWEAGFSLDSVYELLDVVALSTVADMVPLVGDNRIIVKEGLKLVMNENRPCKIFKILREEYNKFVESESSHITQINEEVFGFTYGPAFNSLGRMEGCIDKAMTFLFSDDEDEMRNLARNIYEINELRKKITAEFDEKLLEECKTLYPSENALPSIIILKDDLIPEGIVGLVATHLKDYYHRPCIVFTKVRQSKKDANGIEIIEEKYKGSGRSIDGFDITNSLKQNESFLLGFGGHPGAAGLSVSIDAYDNFVKAELNTANKLITPQMLINQINVDFAVCIADINQDLIDAFDTIRPYGMNFEKPNFGIMDMIIDKYKYKEPDWSSCFCGKDKRTVRLVDQTGFTAIMFRHPETFQDLLDRCDLSADKIIVKPIGYPSLNLFNGVYYPQLIIENNYVF